MTTTRRKWFCACSGQPRGLNEEKLVDEEEGAEPFCPRCGATPSSDPKKTLTYRDQETWDD